MKRDFLIEIGTEEIPAGFINGAIESFHNFITEKLRSSMVSYEKSYFYSTPRRLVVHVTGVDETQKDQVEEVKGPPKKAAFSDIGRPTQAALGFMQTNNATLNDIVIKATPKGEYLFVTKTTKGAPTVTILPALVNSALAALVFPKSMKWDESGARFARPVRWILCLFGEECVKISFGGVESGTVTHGIRRLNRTGQVTSVNSYFDVVKELGVVIETRSRCNAIVTSLNETAEKLGLKPYKDEDLIMEVANLTEDPEPILCEFNPKFLEIPEKIITLTMIKKQRYFPLYDASGKLSNRFVVFSNGKPKQADEVKYGNQKVVAARLSDAEFYYTEDMKTTMDAKSEKLRNVSFQHKLGSVHDKSVRIAKLAQYLYSNLIMKVPPQEDYKKAKLEKIERCAMLCKADLTSEVVKDFTELQGYAGMVYAKREGIDADIADGIWDHYKPCFKGDGLPATTEGQCVGIADKMDTIAGCFVIRMIPTGSGDPYALRRAALGIIEIALHASLSFDLSKFIEFAINLYPESLRAAEKCDIKATVAEIVAFVKQRFETKLKELGMRYDVINATLWNGVANVYEDHRKAACLARARSSKEFLSLVTPFKRAMNITKNAENQALRPADFALDVEKALCDKFRAVSAEVEKALSSNDYFAAFNHLAVLNEPIDAFFNGVMVMDPDEKLKNNRIALLCAIRDLFLKLVDISQLVIEE